MHMQKLYKKNRVRYCKLSTECASERILKIGQ